MISISDQCKQNQILLGNFKGIDEPSWNDHTEVKKFLETCQAAINKIELDLIRSEWNQILNQVKSSSANPKAHPIVGNILSAIKKGSTQEYGKLYEELLSNRN